MVRIIKRLATLSILVTGLMLPGSRIEATNCTTFMTEGDVNTANWPAFTFSCSPNVISCSEVRSCVNQACASVSGWDCDGGDQYFGANGFGNRVS